VRNVRGHNSPTGNQRVGYNKYVFHVKENALIRVFSNVNLEKINDNADYSVYFISFGLSEHTPVLLCRFTNLKIDCLVVATLCLRCSSLWICTADKLFFEYSIIKCRVDIDNLLTLPVFVYKQCLFLIVTWSGEACVRFVYRVSFVRSFVRL
jgi:hypothetical protein